MINGAEKEGFCLGGSSGINIASAVRLADGLGHIIVTILADGGMRYQRRLFNPGFCGSRNAGSGVAGNGFAVSDATAGRVRKVDMALQDLTFGFR